MKRTIFTIITAACLAITAMAQQQAPASTEASTPTLSVGSIPGQFNVSSSGAASYTIPINCPAGINGMQPSISISYNSLSGGGLLGYGTNLSAYSQISRIGKSLTIDQKYEQIKWDNTDNLSLDGERLILVNGTNMTDGAEYRTHYESYRKITINKDNNGKLYIKVVTKDGSIYEYGNTIDSKITPKEKSVTTTWLLNKVTDINGNDIIYNYITNTSNNEYYLASVEYGGNASLNKAPVCMVEFNYETRTDPSDYYYNGIRYTQTKLLKSIVTKSNNTGLLWYEFDYEHDNFYTRLKTINLTNSKNEKLQPTTFNWDSETISNKFTTLVGETKNFDLQNYRAKDPTKVLIDYNEDGLTDLFTYPTINEVTNWKGWKLFRRTSNSVEEVQKEETSIKNDNTYSYDGDIHFVKADVNNDGHADIIELRGSKRSIESRDKVKPMYRITYDNFENAIPSYMDAYSKNSVYSVDVLLWEPGGFKRQNLTGCETQNVDKQNYYTKNDSIINSTFEMGDVDGDGTPELIQHRVIHKPFWKMAQDAYIVTPQSEDINGNRIAPIPLGLNVIVYKMTDIMSGKLNEFTSLDIDGDNLNLTAADFKGNGTTQIWNRNGYRWYAPTTKKWHHSQVFSQEGSFNIETEDFNHIIQDKYLGMTVTVPGDKASPSAHLGDFNGDGRMDLICYNTVYSSKPDSTANLYARGIGENRFGLYLSNGKGFDKVNYRFDFKNQIDEHDRIGQTHDALAAIVVGDFNGDGKSDIVNFWEEIEIPNRPLLKQYQIYYSKLNSSNLTDPFVVSSQLDASVSFSYSVRLHSENIDRLVDGNNKALKIQNKSNKVTSINNGMGQTTKIMYAPMSDTDMYSVSTSTMNGIVHALFPSSPMVKSTQLTTSQYSFNKSYFYENLRISCTDHAMLGVSRFIERDNTNNTMRVNLYGLIANENIPYVSYSGIYNLKTSTALSSSTYTKYLKNSTLGSFTINQDRVKKICDDLMTTTNHLTNDQSQTKVEEYDEENNPTKIVTTTGTLVNTKVMTYGKYGSNAWCKNKVESTTSTTINTADLVNPAYVRTQDFSYDAKGNLITQTNDKNVADAVVTTTYGGYDQFGHPTTITLTGAGTGAGTRTSSTTYTPSGRFIHTKTDALGRTTTYIWNETTGTLTFESDFRKRITSYTYNGWGQQTSVTTPAGHTTTTTTDWVSADPVRLAAGLQYYTYTTAPKSAPVWTWYDQQGRPVVVETRGLKDTDKPIYVYTEYSADGKPSRTSDPTFESDKAKAVWTTVYDSYDDYGRCTSITTPLGTTSTVYDDAHRTTTVTSPSGTQSTTLNAYGQTLTSTVNGKSVSYTYYPSGQVASTTPEGGNPITMKYNLQGQRTEIKDPDAGTTTNYYNSYGECYKEVNPKGTETIYSIEETTGLITHRDRKITPTATPETSIYRYDALAKGLLTEKVICAKDKIAYSYDRMDRVVSQTESIGAYGYTHGYEYDTYGRLTKETYPTGYYVTNIYDDYSNLIEIKDSKNRSIWKMGDRDAKGQINYYTQGGAMNTLMEYDALGRITRIQTPTIADWNYTYHTTTGNLETRKELVAQEQESFAYDTMNRLTSWNVYHLTNGVTTTQTPIQEHSMSYYPTTGNINTKTDVGSNFVLKYNDAYHATTAPAPPHAISSMVGLTLPNGVPNANLQANYTCFNKLSLLSNGTFKDQYRITYGVDDQRITSEYSYNCTPTKSKIYVGNYEIETIKSGTGAGTTRKIHYLSGAMFIQTSNTATGALVGEKLYYTHTDFQGSLTALTNEDGTVAERYAYNPWGARRNPTDWTQTDARTSLITDRGYTGHEHIDLFRVINMNGRVYDPTTAQFLSPDPMLQAPGDWLNYNRYTYCMNNPLKYTDPSGYEVYPGPAWWDSSLGGWRYLDAYNQMHVISGGEVQEINSRAMAARNGTLRYATSEYDEMKRYLSDGPGPGSAADFFSNPFNEIISVNNFSSLGTGTYSFSASGIGGYGTIKQTSSSWSVINTANQVYNSYQNHVEPNPDYKGFDFNKENPLAWQLVSVGYTQAQISQKLNNSLNNGQGSGVGSDIFNYGGAALNIGGSLAGIAEISALAARRFDNGGGSKYLARAMTSLKGSYVGTQEVASNLRSFGTGAKSLGTTLGIAGGVLATVDYALNFQEKNKFEHINYWLGMGVTIGAFANPIGAGVALTYGIGQGVSWFYNGKTLEENVGRNMNW